MFFYCVDADGNMFKHVMVQYWFDGCKHVPHGNSKKNKLPFMRTRESTKEKLRVGVSTQEPRQAYHGTKAVIGKMMDLPSTSAAPRDPMQASNFKKVCKRSNQKLESGLTKISGPS